VFPEDSLADVTLQSPTEPVDKFTPYVPIRDRNIKAQLCRIAELFQFIDNGFAQYFQAVVSRLPHDAVEGYLDSARDEVENKQALDRNQALGQHKDQSDAVRNLGDLGNFCQKVSDRLKLDEERGVLYDITDCTQEDMLHYLQDAFEIPYWRFMLDLFLQQNVNSRSLSATVVFRVLSSLKIEILHRRDAIRRDVAASQNGRREDTEPLMKGIDARVKVLEQVWHKDTFELEASGPYQTLFQTLNPDQPSTAPEEESTTSAKTFSAWPENQQSNAKVNSKLTMSMIKRKLMLTSTRTPSSSSASSPFSSSLRSYPDTRLSASPSTPPALDPPQTQTSGISYRAASSPF
jgi:hypothetical protein